MPAPSLQVARPHIPAPVTLPPGDRRRVLARAEHWVLAGVLFAAYTVVSVGRHRHMAGLSWDLGIFEQVVRAYAQLRTPVADLKGPGFIILGDHFSPVTALLAPPYRLFPSPVTLLVAQAALFALSAVPVTRAAARLLGRRGGLALGLAYGLSWGIQRAVDFDFHEICFAVPLIAFSLEALARRPRAALWWALPLVLVKEDLGLTLAAIALVIAWRACGSSPRTVRYALGVAVFGVAAAVLVLTVIIPSFNTAGGYDDWTKVSDAGSPFDGLATKLRTLAWLLVPTTGLLALRSPLVLVALPTLGWRFLSGDEHYWGTDWHYSAVLMPVAFLALTDALPAVRHSTHAWLCSYTVQLPVAIAAAALALTTSLPLAQLTGTEVYRKPAAVSGVERLLARIPDDATVEANIGPISRLASRCRVFWLGDTQGAAPEYIALENIGDRYRDPVGYARQLHPFAEYDIAGETGGYVLLQRRAAAGG
ncbi:DUF2079 domain-containing protein [Streptomyces sp. SID7499]|uniref:DUF2079 domain-containing protein n=1 Tax=Streptomyces sp. SID7499 TaxID=2706086 RepID=A0A6G3XGI8_9ACTN|nr:DUF2079 domain-containing protein [Streptomyces sp. SID7499]